MAWPRREPSSLHVLALLDKLQFGPQAAEAHNTKDDTPDADIAAYYNYSADGERNIKLTSPRLNIQQNASRRWT